MSQPFESSAEEMIEVGELCRFFQDNHWDVAGKYMGKKRGWYYDIQATPFSQSHSAITPTRLDGLRQIKRFVDTIKL